MGFLCWFFLGLKLSATMTDLSSRSFIFLLNISKLKKRTSYLSKYSLLHFLAIRLIQFGKSLSKFTNYLCIFWGGFLMNVESQQLLNFSLAWFKSTARLFWAKSSEKCTLYSGFFPPLYLHSCSQVLINENLSMAT